MDIPETRRENLRRLFAKHGGPKALAERLNYRTPSFMTQMAGPNPSRPVSERTARSIEQTLALAPGRLDKPQAAQAVPASGAGVAAHYLRVDAAGVNLSPEKFAQILALAVRQDLDTEELARLAG